MLTRAQALRSPVGIAEHVVAVGCPVRVEQSKPEDGLPRSLRVILPRGGFRPHRL
jgi:hypothetical protein